MGGCSRGTGLWVAVAGEQGYGSCNQGTGLWVAVAGEQGYGSCSQGTGLWVAVAREQGYGSCSQGTGLWAAVAGNRAMGSCTRGMMSCQVLCRAVLSELCWLSPCQGLHGGDTGIGTGGISILDTCRAFCCNQDNCSLRMIY